MSKVIDSRLAYDIEVYRFSLKPNVKRVDSEGTVTYVVLLRITYWLLSSSGARLVRTSTRNHDLYPLSNPITGPQFINNLAVLAPLIKAAALADRRELVDP